MKQQSQTIFNYFRQFCKFHDAKAMAVLRSLDPLYADCVENFMKLGARAIKFALPDGGRILSEHPRVPEGARLPFDTVLLEYHKPQDGKPLDAGLVYAPKRLVLATSSEDGQVTLASVFATETDRWVLAPQLITMEILEDRLDNVRVFRTCSSLTDDEICEDASCTIREANAIASLMEALTCVNVTHEGVRSDAGRGKSSKGALPFDEYRVLTIIPGKTRVESTPQNSTSRAPREHLRRGHIRRLPSGTNTWVQQTVVNAGIGGVLHHDYRVEARA